jgi:hypothetical protein
MVFSMAVLGLIVVEAFNLITLPYRFGDCLVLSAQHFDFPRLMMICSTMNAFLGIDPTPCVIRPNRLSLNSEQRSGVGSMVFLNVITACIELGSSWETDTAIATIPE